MKLRGHEYVLLVMIVGIALGWYLDRTYQKCLANEMKWCYLKLCAHLDQHYGSTVKRGPTGLIVDGTRNELPMMYDYGKRFTIPAVSNSPYPADWEGL